MNFYRPQKRKRAKMNVQPPTRVECLGHGRIVRKLICCLQGRAPTPCSGDTVAHHVQSYRAIEGGMGLKVGDHRQVPLCDAHHIPYVHQKGQQYVERECKIDLENVAAECWKADTYHRTKFERDWKEEWGDVPLPYEQGERA